MDGGDWIALAGVISTGGFAAWSAWSAHSAQKIEERVAKHARDAVQAAQDASTAQAEIAARLEEGIQLQSARELRERDAVDAVDADPWSLVPIPGSQDCELLNRSESAKYGVTVSGFNVHDGSVYFEVIRAGKRREVMINRMGNAPEEDVQITWHNRSDLTDAPRSITEAIPPH